MKALRLYFDDGDFCRHFSDVVEHRFDDAVSYFLLVVVCVGRYERTRQVVGVEVSLNRECVLFLAFEDRYAYVEGGREIAVYLLGNEKPFVSLVRI